MTKAEAADKLWMCGRKFPHASKAEAQAAIDRVRQRYGETRLKVYRCPYCKLFHTGKPKTEAV